MSHVENELLPYLDGELSPAEMHAVEVHLATCRQCAAALQELQALRSDLSEVLPAAYESIHLSSSAEARIRTALAAERARQERSGPLQRGFAGLAEAFQAALRPMSKAAIPLFAVLFFVLTANIARLPVQSGVQETLVLGQDTLAPGSQAALRVLVRDGDTNQPVANANVAVQMRHAGLAKTLYTGSTDGTGSAPVNFDVPADWQGDAELLIETASDLGEDEIVAPIRLERAYRLLLSSDKPVYQPGETIHLRTLALGKVDGKPAAGEDVQFEIVDPARQVVLSERVATSEFGIAAVDLPLDVAKPFGQYQVRAALADTTSELSLALGQAPLPAFRVDVEADAPYYLPGDLVTGRVTANYFFGKPIAEGQVDLRLLGSKLGADPAAGEERVFVKELRGETDAAGSFAFQFEIPALGPEAYGDDGTLQLALEATVVNTAGDSEFGWQTLELASQPILIDVVPEGGTLRTGVENILYVLTSYPDGQPAPTSLQVQIGSGIALEEATNDYGLAEVRYTPRAGDAGDRQVTVTATDAAGRASAVAVTLPLDEAKETLLLRTDRAIFQVGDTLALEAVATGSGDAVYVDVIKGGQTLLTKSAAVDAGKAAIGIDLTPEFAGTLEINAFQVGDGNRLLRDTRVVVVDQPENLQVELATDQAEYRPGDDAQLDVRTTRDGEGVEAAVGVSVVNEAVYAQRPYQPGFARAYFILDQALQDSGVSLPDAPLSAAADNQTKEELRAAQQMTAKASWAAYRGQDYSLAAQSMDDASRNQVNTKRQSAFNWLSIGLSLALIAIALLVVVMVLTGLRQSGVLGKAASRLLLTLLLLGLAGAGLLLVAQWLFARLSPQAMQVVLVLLGLLWLVLLAGLGFYGWRRNDQRAQYVALLLLAYAVFLVLLTYAAGQGAALSPLWLLLLAVGFGALLAALLLFGWGLRMEGETRASLVVLSLAILVMPLVMALNAADLSGTEIIQQIAGPSAYGWTGMVTGCAAPPAEPAMQPAAEAPEKVAVGELVTPELAPPQAVEPAPAQPPAPVEESADVLAATPPEQIVETAAPAAEAVTEVREAAAPFDEGITPEISTPEIALPITATAEITGVVEITSAAEISATVEVTAAAEVAGAVELTGTAEFTGTAEVALTQVVTPTLEIAARQAMTGAVGPAGAVSVEADSTALLTGTVAGLVAPESSASFSPTISTGAEAAALAVQAPISAADALAPPPAAMAAAAEAGPPVAAKASAPTPDSVAEPSPQVTPESTPALTPPEEIPAPPPATEQAAAAAQPAGEPTVAARPTLEPAVVEMPAPTATPVAIRTVQKPVPAPIPLEALPIIRQRFPQTLYWNPEAITDQAGRLQLTLPTSDSITTWRITTLAVDRAGHLGSATAPLVVFQPLFLVPNLPAEMAVGEQRSGQIQIFNYSPQPLTVQLAAQASPGLAVEVDGFPLVVPANEVVAVETRVMALASGPQTITYTVRGDNASDARQASILVR